MAFQTFNYTDRMEARRLADREEDRLEHLREKEQVRGTPYVKEVGVKELRITCIAASLGIGAEVLKSTPTSSGRCTMDLYRYAESCTEILREKRYEEYNSCIAEARTLLAQLHSEGILHGDLSEDNIVYNNVPGTTRLIDFGMSYFAADAVLTPEGIIDVEYYIDLYYEGVRYAGSPAPTLEYLQRLEMGCLEFLRWNQ